MNNRTTFLLLIFTVLIAVSGCDQYDGTIRDGVRDITVDVENSIFNEPDAADAWEQGPGVDTIRLSFVMDSGEISKMLVADDKSAGDYTQVVQQVSGVLERIDATAVNAAGTSMTVSIEEKPSYEEFNGWEIFANLQRFRLGFNGNSAGSWESGYLTLDIAPRGGTAVRLKTDSGVSSVMTTDWGGAALTSRQVAVEPLLSENPEGLSFDIYILIVDEDLREVYGQGPAADYEYYPWVDVWSYEELTETGRRISDKTYSFTKYNSGDPLSFVEPSGTGSGYNSFLIDLGSETDDPVGKYLMIALVLKYDVFSVPSAVDIIEIK